MFEESIALVTAGIIVVAGYITYLGFSRPGFLERNIFDPRAIIHGKEAHRLLTAGFLHANWVHFGFNAFSLYSFGGHIERAYGAPVLLLVFFSSLLGGNILSLWLHRNHRYRALGASGGVCGVIFATIFLLPGGAVYMFFIPIPIPAYIYAILFLLISFYGIRTGFGNIGHDAHLGGAIVGLAVTTLLYPRIVVVSPVLYAFVMGISLAFFVLLSRRPLEPYGRRLSLMERIRIAVAGRKRRTRHAADERREREVARLLEKVSNEGLGSLSPAERVFLEAASKRRSEKENERRRYR